MKRQTTEREKSFAKHTSGKGFIARTYKESQNNNKKNYSIYKNG